MALDIQESLRTALYALLTGDATLKSLMGGTVRLYPVTAKPDAVMPYLVHRIDMGNDGDWDPFRRCTYIIDLYSSSPGSEETTDIRQRIMTLVNELDSSTDETTDFHLWIQADSDVPDPSENTFHYVFQFNLKYLRDGQVGTLLKR